MRRHQVREFTAARVEAMRVAIERPAGVWEVGEYLRPASFRPGDIARLYAVPLRFVISWQPRRGRKSWTR